MNRDRTGPEGKGPMTGRGQGFCIDFEMPEIEMPEFGKMFGGGFGRGYRFRIQQKEYTKEEQIELLKKQKKVFEERAFEIGKQLKEYYKPLKKSGKPLVKKPLVKKKVRGKK